MENKQNARLSPPMWTVHRQISALFGKDVEINIKEPVETDAGVDFIIIVSNNAKAQAIKALLKNSFDCGVHVNVYVYGADENTEVKASDIGDIKTVENAFAGNPIFFGIKDVSSAGRTMAYCIFKKEVIQFWNDDLSDFYGNCSTLPHFLAIELFNDTIVSFCTGIE
jgi:hypothetical protein